MTALRKADRLRSLGMADDSLRKDPVSVHLPRSETGPSVISVITAELERRSQPLPPLETPAAADLRPAPGFGPPDRDSAEPDYIWLRSARNRGASKLTIRRLASPGTTAVRSPRPS